MRSASPTVARLIVLKKRLEPASAAPITAPAQEDEPVTAVSPPEPSRLVGGA